MRKQRGFTLVEVAIAAAVVATLAALSVAALRGMRLRGAYAGATGDVIGALRLARSESFGRGQAVYFIVDANVATDALGNPTAPRWWVLLDVGGNFDFALWDPANPSSLGDKVLSSGIFPAGVKVGAAAGYPQALAAPYQLIPAAVGTTPTADPAYCSFCLAAGAHPNYGWVRFAPGAAPAATFSGNTASTFGQQLTVLFDNGSRKSMMVVGILARSGAIFSAEQVL
ncbi:MAG TPA: prepilin-type N-terminal cleavage/methylation domain-containing protein [Myxococcales bacterium]|nr:prepilin-type N-terminal cleavage/methylation domain-containing protein [Myxococcales bacterium]